MVGVIPNVRRDCAICESVCVSFWDTILISIENRAKAYIVVSAETEYDFAMHVPALQSSFEVVIRGSEDCC